MKAILTDLKIFCETDASHPVVVFIRRSPGIIQYRPHEIRTERQGDRIDRMLLSSRVHPGLVLTFSDKVILNYDITRGV